MVENHYWEGKWLLGLDLSACHLKVTGSNSQQNTNIAVWLFSKVHNTEICSVSQPGPQLEWRKNMEYLAETWEGAKTWTIWGPLKTGMGNTAIEALTGWPCALTLFPREVSEMGNVKTVFLCTGTCINGKYHFISFKRTKGFKQYSAHTPV